MLDINLFRNDLPAVAAGLAKRGLTLDAARFEALERERKDIQTRTQDMQAKRNVLSKQIGAAKGKGEDASALLAEVAGIGARDEAPGRRARPRAGRSCAISCSTCRTSRIRACRSGSRPTTTSRCAAGARRARSTFRSRDHTDIGEGLGPARLRDGGQALRRALHVPARRARAAAPRARAVHARHADRASTATPSATRPTSSMPRRWSARRSCRNSKPTCSR